MIIKLFVGLGNPGETYERNRHNVGFKALDYIAKQNIFLSWRHKFDSLFCEGTIEQKKILLIKPQTFMNLSGNAIKRFIEFYKIPIDQLTVFHDELDLNPSEIKFKCGGGHAGHNGLRSIHEKIGSDYNRIRIGIGRPENKNLVSKYVLNDFTKVDSQWLDKVFDKLNLASKALSRDDFECVQKSLK